jgi:uncharacterized protein YjeT (DUF2065 family)
MYYFLFTLYHAEYNIFFACKLDIITNISFFRQIHTRSFQKVKITASAERNILTDIMSAEQSLKNSFIYIGVLLIIEGLSLLLCPHLTAKLLFLLPLQTTQAEQYARAAGLGLTVIGYYYIVGGKYASIGFYR